MLSRRKTCRFALSTSLFAFVAACSLSAFAQTAGTGHHVSQAASPTLHSMNLQFPGEQPRPLAMVSGDFDEDGYPDVVVGYGLSKGGSIALLRGNADAIAPTSKASWEAVGRGEYIDAFKQQSNLIKLPTAPGAMLAADLNGDGHLDLAYVSKQDGTLHVMFGTGHGTFALKTFAVKVPGKITALSSFKAGAPVIGDAVLVGYETPQGGSVALLSQSDAGLAIKATYPLPSAPKSFATGFFDSDLIPDVAIVAGGELFVLHGKNSMTGAARMETLPVGNVEAVEPGTFLFDRHPLPQLSVLTSNGQVLILAHQGFDARPWTREESMERRREVSLHIKNSPLAPKVTDNGGAPWVEVERHSEPELSGIGSNAPILLHGQMNGSGGDDLVVLNTASQQQVTISHRFLTEKEADTSHAMTEPALSSKSRIKTSSLISGSVVSALAMRVSADGRPGLVVLRAGNASPEIVVPHANNTFYVGTTADTNDTFSANLCISGNNSCSLRDAITYANEDAGFNGGSGSDTIMVPAGTYQLTFNEGEQDGQANFETHLEIFGPMTVIGAGAGSTIIEGNTDANYNNDMLFEINPGTYGSYNGQAALGTFTSALQNMTLQNAINKANPNTNGSFNNLGGAILWTAEGSGALNLTNVNLQNNSILYGPGGAMEAYDDAGGGSATLTITGGTISGNTTPEQGGAIYNGFHAVGITVVNTVFNANEASTSINTGDGEGSAGLGHGGAYWSGGRGVGTGIPEASFTGVTFSNNIADGEGGGIYSLAGFTLTGAKVTGNQAKKVVPDSSGDPYEGGGIYARISLNIDGEVAPQITNSDFLTNFATSAGGAIETGPDEGKNPTETTFQISGSRIYGNTSTSGATGLAVGDNVGTPTSGEVLVTASNNWWGCNAGPGNTGCDSEVEYTGVAGTVTTSPNTVLGVTENGSTVVEGNSINITTTLDKNSIGQTISFTAADSIYPYTLSVTGLSSTLSPSSPYDFSSGTSTVAVTPTTTGSGVVHVTFDGQPMTVNFTANAAATLSVSTTHTGTFTQGSTGTWNVVVSNTSTGSAATGTTTVVDTLPSGYTLSGSSGTGWTCGGSTTVTCTSVQPVVGGSSYSTLVLTVNIPTNSATSVTNNVVAFGGGDPVHTNSGNGATGSDTVGVVQVAASVAVNSGSGQQTNISTQFGSPLTAIVKDAGGVAISGASVTFTAPGSGASGTFSNTTNSTTSTTNSSGIAASSLFTANGTAGTYNVSATSGSASTNFSLTNVQPPATHFSLSVPGSTTAGVGFSFTVTALTAGNAQATGYTGTVHFTSSDGQGVLPANTTLTNGTGTFVATLKTGGAQIVTATDTTNGSISGLATVAVNAASASIFSVTAPPTATAGASFNASVTALDQFGNTATGFSGTVHFSSSDGQAILPANSTLVNGAGTFGVNLKTAGVQSVTATDTVSASLTGTAIVSVSPGATSFLQMSVPPTAVAGAGFTFTVSAYDPYGNLTPAYSDTVAFTSSDPLAYFSTTPGTLSGGVGTFPATLFTAGNQTITATDTTLGGLNVTSSGTTVSPNYLIVNVNTDDAGIAGNCTTQTAPGTNTADGSCSLRDALANAASSGAGSISFDTSVFAAAQTIALTNGTTLAVPSNTTVTGPTTGTGATQVNLLTVSGGGSATDFPVITTNASDVNTVLANLIISGGNSNSGTTGGIYNGYQAALTLLNSTVSGNTAAAGTGGIFNDYNATLTITGSTISGNSGGSGGIVNEAGGTVTVTNSTISGNTASNSGGGIISGGAAVTVTSSTISGNTATFAGGGIVNNSGTLTVSNSVVSGNTASTSPDVYAASPYTDNGGNLIGDSAATLSPLANYGGPTQTQLPLPGSDAVCGGTVGNDTSLTTDQRGFARTTTYSAACADSGAAQTNYTAVAFDQANYTSKISQAINPGPVVSVTENGQNIAGIPVTVGFAGTGNASGLGPVNTVAGVGATFSGLSVDTAATGDTLSVSLPVIATGNAVTTPALTASAGLTVNPLLVPSVVITLSANPVNIGAPLTITATVTGGGATPSGSVRFFSDFAPLGTVALDGSGVASFPTSSLPVGVHTIAASYTGDLNYSLLNATPQTLTVARYASSVTVGSSAPAVAVGSPVTLTATVSGSDGAPTGTVAFYANNILVGQGTLSGGVATLPISTLAGGIDTITAHYLGDGNYLPSISPSLSQEVDRQATTVSLTPSASPVSLGAPLTLTATVATTLTGVPPTGAVRFFDGYTLLGTGTLTGGVATYQSSSLALGKHSFIAEYTGDSNYSPASGTDTDSVGKAPSTITVTTLNNPSAVGKAVTFTATVGTGVSSTTPTGTVNFYSGNSIIGQGTLTSGVATFQLSTLAGGVDTITAHYLGDANYQPAFSLNLTEVVARQATNVSLSPSPSPVNTGAQLTLTAAVATTLVGSTPTGTVRFFDGFTLIGSGTLTAGVATYQSSTLLAGKHTFTAEYSGDTNYSPVSGTASVTVTKVATTVAVTTPNNPSPVGQPVTFTATVSTGVGTANATGTINFYSGNTLIGQGVLSGNQATFNTSALPHGVLSITAQFWGDANYLSARSPILTEVIH